MSKNISEMIRSGHPQKQAIAAAYSMARKSGATLKKSTGFYDHLHPADLQHHVIRTTVHDGTTQQEVRT